MAASVVECRVGRTLPRGAGAGARRRSSAPPASPVRHQQTIATNKRSTSAAAQRPPAAPQSAAQAAGAARATRRSISHAHRSPQARAGQSERCHKPPQRSCLNRGAVAHHPLARAASAALARAHARIRRERVNAGPLRLIFQHHALASTPWLNRAARPAAAAANIISIDVAVWRRVSCWPLTLPRGCRRVAASVVLAAHAAARMSPCGGECRVGRSRCRADVAVWRRVSCWSHAAARWPVVAGAAPIRGTASIARSPPTNDRHQQTIDVGRRAAAAHRRTERRTGASRSSRTPQVDSHAHRSPRPRARQSERCHKPPQRSC